MMIQTNFYERGKIQIINSKSLFQLMRNHNKPGNLSLSKGTLLAATEFLAAIADIDLRMPLQISRLFIATSEVGHQLFDMCNAAINSKIRPTFCLCSVDFALVCNHHWQ